MREWPTSRILRRLQLDSRCNPTQAGKRTADGGRDFARPVEVPTRCQLRFARGSALQSRNNGRLNARLIDLIKDYRTVSSDTGTISLVTGFQRRCGPSAGKC